MATISNIISAGIGAVGLLSSLGVPGLSGILGGIKVTLGGIEFSGMEVPEKIPFGGTQQTVTNKFPGGDRQVQVMGADDRDIDWSGKFYGNDAISRALIFEDMKNKGLPVDLVWDNFKRQVIIKSFEADYETQGLILSYKISCIVLKDFPQIQNNNALSSITKDISNSLGISGLASEAQTVISIAQKALPIVGALTKNGPGYVSMISSLGMASNVLNGIQATANGNIKGIIQSGVLLSSSSSASTLSTLTLINSNSASLATSTASSSFISRSIQNLSNSST